MEMMNGDDETISVYVDVNVESRLGAELALID